MKTQGPQNTTITYNDSILIDGVEYEFCTVTGKHNFLNVLRSICFDASTEPYINVNGELIRCTDPTLFPLKNTYDENEQSFTLISKK
jgi:hypothetical protein